MFNRLERYVSKSTPNNALEIIKKHLLEKPKDYQMNDITPNTLYQYYGLIQRRNIEPERFLASFNKQRIGYHQRAQISPKANADSSMSFSEQSMNRKARIFFAEINHMQCTPSYRRGQWCIQIENSGYVRSHSMHWSRSGDDSFHKWGDRDEMRYSNVEIAISQIEGIGYEYEVIYPHERYHQTKAYADNFTFKKESISDVEDEEEVFEQMQKLV